MGFENAKVAEIILEIQNALTDGSPRILAQNPKNQP